MKSEKGILYIKKRSFPEWAVLLTLFLPFIFSFFTELLNLPGALKFVIDFVLAAMTILMVSKRPITVSKNLTPLVLLIIAFFIFTFATYFLNYQSIFYYFWGFRNNFRFFVAFYIYAKFISEDWAKGIFTALDKIFWVNIAVVFVQLMLGYQQDCLGGVFGVEKGCNGYLVNFLLIIVVKSVLSFMNGMEGIIRCFSKCAVSLFISAVAELKFFFIVFVLVVMLAFVLTPFSWRKFGFILSATVATILSALLLVTMFEYFRDFFSLGKIWEIATQKNYASDNDMNRFSAIPTINEIFLKDIPSRLFGMGLGNCDTSTFSIFNTPFYDTYVDLHYSIFSVSFIYLETGFVGLALYFLFFALCLKFAYKNFRKKTGNLLFNQMGIIMALMCFILIFYNSSLRTEAGFLIYFVLALPFVGARAEDENKIIRILK